MSRRLFLTAFAVAGPPVSEPMAVVRSLHVACTATPRGSSSCGGRPRRRTGRRDRAPPHALGERSPPYFPSRRTTAGRRPARTPEVRTACHVTHPSEASFLFLPTCPDPHPPPRRTTQPSLRSRYVPPVAPAPSPAARRQGRELVFRPPRVVPTCLSPARNRDGDSPSTALPPVIRCDPSPANFGSTCQIT